MTTHVLILCTHNSARSILAESMLNHLAKRMGKDVCAHSAGSAPSGRVNPFALDVLRNAGVDTTNLRSKSWDEFAGAAAGPPLKIHWGYPDPSNTLGDDGAKSSAFEVTRQAIAARMQRLLTLPLASMSRAELAAALVEIGR